MSILYVNCMIIVINQHHVAMHLIGYKKYSKLITTFYLLKLHATLNPNRVKNFTKEYFWFRNFLISQAYLLPLFDCNRRKHKGLLHYTINLRLQAKWFSLGKSMATSHAAVHSSIR